MADYASNFTARLKLTYSTYGDIHKLGLRFDASLAQSAVVASGKSLLNDIWTACAGFMTGTFTVLDLEYSAANSSFFAPVSISGLTPGGTVVSGVAKGDEIVMTTWSGRSLLGHKGKFCMFGLYWGLLSADFDDFAVTASEEAAVATVAGLLASTPELVMNDNQPAVFWRPRATIKQSDAWVDVRRP